MSRSLKRGMDDESGIIHLLFRSVVLLPPLPTEVEIEPENYLGNAKKY